MKNAVLLLAGLLCAGTLFAGDLSPARASGTGGASGVQDAPPKDSTTKYRRKFPVFGSKQIDTRPSWAEAQFKRVEKQEDVFVPRGQWLIGGTFSYSEHANDNYKLVVIENWNGLGYTITPTVFAGYAFKDNTVAGLRFSYSRNLLQVDKLDLNLGDDLDFDISDYHNLQQTYHGTLFLRNYLSLFRSRRFGLFNDMQLTLGGGQGKILNHLGEELNGTYEKIFKLDVGIAPGLAVFATNNVALEVSVGVLGFSSTWVKQITNQVEQGSRHSSKGTFKIDLFSIRLGIAFYLNSKRFHKYNTPTDLL